LKNDAYVSENHLIFASFLRMPEKVHLTCVCKGWIRGKSRINITAQKRYFYSFIKVLKIKGLAALSGSDEPAV
jgi:hypothetical protein